MTTIEIRLPRIVAFASLPLVWALGTVAPASAIYIYTYSGASNFDQITDNTPPAGATYDTSMSVSGWFTYATELDTGGNWEAINPLTWSFTAGPTTLTDANSSHSEFDVFAADGIISQWDIQLEEFHTPGLHVQFDRLMTASVVSVIEMDVAQRIEYTNDDGPPWFGVFDEGRVLSGTGSWSVVPEPTTAALVVLGLAVLAHRAHRRRG